jgi:hypothetical protein
MEREEIIGNVTTIGKFILLTFGTPSLVSFANSSDFAILIGAIFGLIWAFYDSKYFNTFFNRNKKVVSSDEGILNDEYTSGDADE